MTNYPYKSKRERAPCHFNGVVPDAPAVTGVGLFGVRAKDVRREVEAALAARIPRPPRAGEVALRLIREAAGWFAGDRGRWVAAVLGAAVLVLAAGFAASSAAGRPHKPAVPAGVGGAPTSGLAPFVCASEGMGSGSAGQTAASIGGLTTATTAGYDRVVVLFSDAFPTGGIELRPQTKAQLSATFGSPQPHLAGSNAVLVIIQGARLGASYRGPTDIKPNYPALKEVRVADDSAGLVQIALGINGPGCYRPLLVSDPNRLVVDVPNR